MKRFALLFVLWPALCAGQVTIFPESVDFGKIATGDYVPSYTRIVELTNRGEVAVRVGSLSSFYENEFDISLHVDFYRPEYGGVIEPPPARGGAIVEAGERLFIRLRWAKYHVPGLPYTYRDTVFLQVSDPETWALFDSVAIPVTGEVVESAVPVAVAPEYEVYSDCLCDLTRPKTSGISPTLRVYVLNPIGTGYPLVIDSFTVEPIAGSGITRGWFQDKFESGEGYGNLPMTLQPDRSGWLRFGTPHQLGEHRSRVRVFGRYQDGSETPWVGESVLYVQVRQSGTEPLALNPSRAVFGLNPGTVVNDNHSFDLFKCELPDSVPMWFDTAYFTGPRQPAIELVKRAGADSLPVLPVFLRSLEPVGYNVRITRALTFPGVTTDTITAHYHYEDPQRGRVDGVRKVTVQIDIRGETVSVRYDPVPVVVVEVSPNPARDRLRIVCFSTGIGEGMWVRLYDMQGREVFGRSFPLDEAGRAEVDLSELPAGAYRAVVLGRDGRAVVSKSVMIVR